MKLFRTSAVIIFAFTSFSALAADYPTPKQSDWVARDFKFHTGDVMPELRIHYTTVGEPSGQPVLVLHGSGGSAASMLTPAFAGALFGPGQPLDAAKYYIIIPDAHRPRQILQALRRTEGQIPEIRLRRHGRRPAPAAQRRSRRPTSAPHHR